MPTYYLDLLNCLLYNICRHNYIMRNVQMKVAVIGHRKINKTQDLVNKLTETIVNLIVNEGADTFLFGSKSEFNNLCYEVVTELRYTYPHIKRVFIRAEYQNISDDYLNNLLTFYEDTFYPKNVEEAGALAYVVRNEYLVLMCDILLAYYNPNCKYRNRQSGTKMAVEFAGINKKRIINVFSI